MKWHIGITIDRELFKEIEEARGREKRSTFIEYLIKLGLKAHRTQKAKQSEEPIIKNSKRDIQGETYGNN